MPRRPISQAPQAADLSPDRMRQGVRRLERVIVEVQAFDPGTIQTYDDTSRADAISTSVKGALAQTFGHNTAEYQRYSGAAMFSWPINYMHPTPIPEIRESVRRCRIRSLELLNQARAFLVQELEFQNDDKDVSGQGVSPRAKKGVNVVIGHGRSLQWHQLKDFIQDRLDLPVDEFNRVSVAGIATVTRLSAMLEGACFAFLVLTAEDEQADGKVRARENVVHELGLFQGRLGFRRAIILLEDGCEEFSNIHGLGQIRFAHGKINAAFEEIRAVFEREGVKSK